MSGDDRLREHFAALRRLEAERAPHFEATLAAARPARPVRLPWLLAAGMAGLALLWLVVPPRAPAPADAFAVGGWETATDVLLATPGAELLGNPGWDPALRIPEPTETGPTSRIRGRSHG